MSAASTPSVVRQIGSLFDGGSIVGLGDRQLLERFTAHRDAAGEAAFAALVSRHGPMVLDICVQILADRHDAEDAFQAVFLVLARKARSIRDPDLLGNWLYGVALRTARKARVQLACRRKNERGAGMRRWGSDSCGLLEPSAQSAEERVLAREQAELLYGEIDRLPSRFRLPIVLCYFEGLTLDDAARRLRCPAGTVRSRLARACQKLRRGLNRRGVALPAVIVSALASRPASAAVSTSLCDITARAAMSSAAGRAGTGASSAFAIALAGEVLRSMLIHKLEHIAVATLLLGALAAGLGYTSQASVRQPGQNDVQKGQAGKPDVQCAAAPDDVLAKPAAGRMFVSGRVVDANGQPMPDAAVIVYARPLEPEGAPYRVPTNQNVLGEASADASGGFRIDVPRISSSRHDMFGAVALVPGHGAGWVGLDPDRDEPIATITLRARTTDPRPRV